MKKHFLPFLFLYATSISSTAAFASGTIQHQPVEIQRGSSITLTASTTGDTYEWTPATGLSGTTTKSVTASPTALGSTTYTCKVTKKGGSTDTDNLISLGGFEFAPNQVNNNKRAQNKMGDWIDYEYLNFDQSGVNIAQGAVTTARNANNVKTAYFYNTLPHSGNYMLVADGGNSSNARVWSARNLKLKSGVTYQFSVWAANIDIEYAKHGTASLAKLKFVIENQDGTRELCSFTVKETLGEWNEFKATYVATKDYSGCNIYLVNFNTYNEGNNFALDDIYFGPEIDSDDVTIETFPLSVIEASSVGNCTVNDNGDAIPAGTMIYFDNSNGAIPDGAIYLSVPTESGNGNATTMNPGSYVPNKDKWYPMENIGDGIWCANITEASSYGRMSFWSKDMSAYSDVWQATVAFQIPYQGGKNIFKSYTPSCYNYNRQTTYATKGDWNVRSGLDLMSSAYSMDEGDTTPITLTAYAVGISGSSYTFEYRPFDSDQWDTLATQNSATYVLNGARLPGITTYYRVKRGDLMSEEIKIFVKRTCDTSSEKNIFRYDFGTFTELSGTNSRKSATDIALNYTFKDWPGKVNDGYYAVVPTPYHCGCGGASSGCSEDDDVTHCDGCNMWFRDLGDHSNPSHSSAPYGGMLFINFDQNKSKIAYSHELTAAEKGHFVKGSTLSFSAWIASATTKNPSSGTNIPINLKLSIQYKQSGSTAWQTKAFIATQVSYDEMWKQGMTSIDIEDVSGDYRVIIENNAASGVGNDVLIDDISLDLCTTNNLSAEFYNNSDVSYTSYDYNDVDNVEHIRISKKDYGFGNSNTVLLVSVDESKSIGQAGRYKYLGQMSLNSAGTYYTTDRTATQLMNELNVTPDYTGKLQVIITEYGINIDAFVGKLEDGTIKPFPVGDTSVLASTNMLTYTINCNNNINASLSSNIPVCEEGGKKENDLPNINVSFGHISSNVKYWLVQDGTTELVSGQTLSTAEVETGAFTIDLNKTKFVRTSGKHTVSIQIREYMEDSNGSYILICEKTVIPSSIVVENKPSYNIDSWSSEADYCKQKEISVQAEHTTAYKWYVDKSDKQSHVENWEVVSGATKPTINLPVNLENGWRYKVELANEYCATLSSSPVTVNKVVSDVPAINDYDGLVTLGTKPLADLVTSDKTELHWYLNGAEVVPAVFSTSEVGSWTYSVTNTEEGKCVSNEAAVSVTIKDQFTHNGIKYHAFNYETQPYSVKVISNTPAYSGDVSIPSIVEYAGITFKVEEIGASAFENCTNLTSVTLPSSLSVIRQYAFAGCTGLTSMVIPNGVTTIENNAFQGCKNMTSVNIGEGIETLGEYAFDGCRKLFDVICMSEYPPEAFENSFSTWGYLYIQCDKKIAYTLDPIFKDFYEIRCLGADPVAEPVEEVVTIPSETAVELIWPANDNADTYSIKLTVGGKDFCSLVFNSSGQLLSINFSVPNLRSGEVLRATEVKGGFRFTVTGLTEGTEYDYTISQIDSNNTVIKQFTGEFSTLGDLPTDVIETSGEGSQSVHKELHDGRIVIIRGDEQYDLKGTRFK